MTHKNFPRKAKIIKGYWKKDDIYGDIWCKIEEVTYRGKSIQLSLLHPKLGGFAWVDASDCEFK